MRFDQAGGTRWTVGACGLLLGLGMAALSTAAALAQDGPPGITEPTKFAPFDPNAAACSPPPGLARVLAFAQDNEREFMQGVDFGLSEAAADRGLEYRRATANNDAAKMVEQVQLFRASKVGAVIAAPVDPASLAYSLQQVMWDGGYVSTIVPPPATLLLNAPQYETGKVLTDAAIAYINDHLGGKANVVLLTQDQIEFLAPRFRAMRDGLSKLPGVTIVADVTPDPVNKEGGFATMSTILQAHPNVDVVLGADTVVLGALAALEAAGKARPDQFLGGIDGEPEAVAAIKKGGGPYKASISLSSPVFGYALGNFAADWLDGKSVPQAMDILPSALTGDNIAQYEADLKDPGAVFADPARRDDYLKMYGNICYDTRDQYVNFPWSSEM
ncbi:sugar ABC transporter substrate-binding protein [Devosia sp.]|jgi:ribose transport system substrate-binding protein|uniref:sugar ABC transporter substrate-binding protein n=1 Tax=Devosia sp. TaxID=1871048 RepID=UPI0025C07FE8|nr:sugar ABC transporter substrate-binding protein [Devosia sp.]